MKKIIITTQFLLSIFSISINAQILTIDVIKGKWTNEDKSRVIEFVQNGNTYEAIIRYDEDKSLVGQKQISGLQISGENTFKNGTVHIIKKGKSAKCTAKILSNNKLELRASNGLISKSQIWTKL